jgi:hypothetical protein
MHDVLPDASTRSIRLNATGTPRDMPQDGIARRVHPEESLRDEKAGEPQNGSPAFPAISSATR